MEPIRASRRKHHVIYKTTCLITGRWYIGMHSTDDLVTDQYLGSGVRLTRSLKKHGRINHVREILEELPSRELASLREKELITSELRADPLCMNCGAGGLGAVDRPATKEETRSKISAKTKAAHEAGKFKHLKGLPQSPESIAKRVAKNTGKKRTAEQLANLAKAQQDYYSNVDPEMLKERGQRAKKTKDERGTNRGGRPVGIPMTEEQKLRQSVQSKGKLFSDLHKQKLRGEKPRASCICCKKETTVGALSRYHVSCS